MGHNYDSAARMGKLSTILRAYAWPGDEPGEVLTAVDQLMAGSDLDILATCLYVKLVPERGCARLRYSVAGHPPAVVRRPDGRAELLEGGRGAMLGVSRLMAPGTVRPPDGELELPSGSTLVCFTDGLIDAFSAEPDIDAGLAELLELISRLPPDATPRAMVDEVAQVTSRHADDVAAVALRIG
jgi:serine phosphatase RsbU (regulator of sigma subunit)